LSLKPGDIKGLWLKLHITEYTPRIPAALLVDWALLQEGYPHIIEELALAKRRLSQWIYKLLV
jgi:hypothetical protein